jgi:hypothetical protein
MSNRNQSYNSELDTFASIGQAANKVVENCADQMQKRKSENKGAK